jgi:hypothetical protein
MPTPLGSGNHATTTVNSTPDSNSSVVVEKRGLLSRYALPLRLLQVQSAAGLPGRACGAHAA